MILIVEDEAAIREMTAFGLRRAGFDVEQAEDCRSARTLIADRPPDLILLDWMLPEMSGLEFVRSLKKDRRTSEIPVIMFTARGEEEDRVKGLDGGADDYVTKPFSARELHARIRALLRRAAPTTGEVLRAADLELDVPGHRVSIGGRAIGLGPTEFKLLKFDSRQLGHTIDALTVVKALERIGDHAKNIAEHIVFLVTGQDVRHADGGADLSEQEFQALARRHAYSPVRGDERRTAMRAGSVCFAPALPEYATWPACNCPRAAP